MEPKEMKRYYEFLKDDLRNSIGAEAYRRLFRKSPTYWRYPLGIGA